MRALLVLAVLAAVPATAHAGSGGVFIPPMRVDVGPQMSTIDEAPAAQVVAGIHWASVYPKPKANIDVGVGIVSTTRSSADPEMTADTRALSTGGREPLSLLGGYVEVATRTNGNAWWRNWVGTRVESGSASLDHRNHAFVGVATRVSTEAFVAGGGGGSGSVVLGVLAIGFYGELSVRKIDDVGTDYGVSLGLTMRVPLIAAH